MTILLGIGTGLATSRRANVNNSTPIFAPDQLFTGGTKGAWYDPSVLSTMFQDTTMAVPVAAHNDPVRVIKDKSGNSNHLVSPSDEARPIYQTDGTRKWLVFVDGEKWLRSDIIGIAETTTDNIYIAAASDNKSSNEAKTTKK